MMCPIAEGEVKAAPVRSAVGDRPWTLRVAGSAVIELPHFAKGRIRLRCRHHAGSRHPDPARLEEAEVSPFIWSAKRQGTAPAQAEAASCFSSLRARILEQAGIDGQSAPAPCAPLLSA